MPRTIPLRDPVTLTLDGRDVAAERGEPAAVSLVAAGFWALARSPKFHRPRGPTCFRAACDGCLARVDGVPNVMTCRTPAAEGLTIETQNVVGSRETDWLRVTDWFFPEGMNHHELVAGVPGVSRVMQAFARRIAGLGKLPTARPRPTASDASRRRADVLVVGAGPAGIAAALALSERGREVEVVDDDLQWGGSLHALGVLRRSRAAAAGAEAAWAALAGQFARAVDAGRIRLRLRTTALGLYGDDVLLGTAAAEATVEVVQATTLVLAPGAHDGAVAFEGNDLPGVLSARAACALLARGVAPGEDVVVVSVDGGTAFGEAYARREPRAVRIDGTPLVARGTTRGGGRVRSVEVETAGGRRRETCDALLVDAPAAPSFELCVQAGAHVVHERRGFVVRPAQGGALHDGVYAIGEAVGTPLDPDAIADAADRLAR